MAGRLRLMSLRSRLMLGLLALAAVGLVVLDLVSYTALRSYLTDRVDQQVTEATFPAARVLSFKHSLGKGGRRVPGPEGLSVQIPRGEAPPLPPPGGPAGEEPPGPAQLFPPGTFAELRNRRGQVVARQPFSYGESGLPRPQLPAQIPSSGRPGSPDVFTVGGADGSTFDFRAAALPLPGGSGTVVVAVPLSDVEQTLHRLRLVELIVTGAVLAALAALAWWVIRLGLRPLERMGETANAIAGGDLSARVESTDERTEVGRLGVALNSMLGQIEESFAKRRASEERLRRFLADASHELRTPLSSIRGYAEVFRLGPGRDPDELEKAMSRIETEATRMGGLVDDLLTLARLDEVPEPARDPVDLGAIAAEAVDDARTSAPGREIDLELDGAAEVVGDRERLRQVATNLLRNALAHTPPGTPIEVSLRVAGREARLEVRDHGPGLPEGDEERVFERFWRHGARPRRDDGGAGLGLAIVATVAAAHGGRAEARNAPDGGAIFTVALPVRAPVTVA